MIGTTFSHYRILEQLGQGGMGIVYKAEDTKLNRTVAIKILPAAALADSDSRERFYREARAAAALHHPHIATVFAIDEAIPEGAAPGTPPSPFIAMEYIDGGTLRSETEKGPMPLRRAVTIAGQIAEALKAAHAKEIVHRDIKGHNVMLTREGDAKVLDFGLAKTAQSTMLTRMGSTLGTVAYMSPEQARGEEVDQRTDLWSLGVVLYEMVSGRMPFPGEYDKAVMYGILNEMPPPLTGLRTGVPMGLEWIVTKLLAKNPDERYQTATDLLVDLKTVDLNATGMSRISGSGALSGTVAVSGASEGPTGDPRQDEAQRKPRQTAGKTLPVWVYALFLPIGIGLGWLVFGRSNSAPPIHEPARKYVLEIPGASLAGGLGFSHDGTLAVGTLVTGPSEVSISSVDLRSGDVMTLVPNEGAGWTKISFDDEWVGYISQTGLYRVRLTGGAPNTIFESPELGGFVWMPDGRMIVAVALEGNATGIWEVPVSGDTPRLIALPDSALGKAELVAPVYIGRDDLVLATLSSETGNTIVSVSLADGSISEISDGEAIDYVDSGHLVYFAPPPNQTRVLVRAFDPVEGAFLGPASTVEETAQRWQVSLDSFGNYYSAALVNVSAGNTQRIVVKDGDGERRVVVDDIVDRLASQPRLSRGGRFAIVREQVDNHDELRIYDLETGLVKPFTNATDGDADNGAFSPDGKELVIEVDDRLYRRNTDGSGSTVELPTESGAGAMDWSSSGRYVVHTSRNIDGFSDLYVIDLENGESRKLDAGPGRHGWPRFSPDDRFISYATRNGADQTYWVLSLEDGNRKQIGPAAAGYVSAWSDAGDFLYYISNGGIYRVSIRLSPYFDTLGAPELVAGPEASDFDVARDRFIAIEYKLLTSQTTVARFGVIDNWTSELAEIAPAVRDR